MTTPGRAALLHTLTLTDFPRPAVARVLSPNGRAEHWAIRRQARLDVYERVWANAKMQNLPRMRGLVTVQPTFTYPEQRRRDQDNLCTGVLKATLDSLVKGGWLEDDSSEYVRLEPPVIRVEPGRRALVLEFWT